MRDKTKVKVERPEEHVQKKLFYHLYGIFSNPVTLEIQTSLRCIYL